MARIRTIKPELFRHELLFEAEKETCLPLRLAFAALLTCADKAGRFQWRPRALKLDCLPYDDIDFSRVLDALVTRGFIVHYACGTREFGCFPTWRRHQVINNKEKDSEIPEHAVDNIINHNEINNMPTREPRVNHALGTRDNLFQGEGKGREGEKEGKGREGKGRDLCADVARNAHRDAHRDAHREIWAAYSDAYRNRYGVEPVRNAKIAGQVAQLRKRLGQDAAPVAAYYCGHGAQWYATKGHAFGTLLADAEKLHTEWQTGRQITTTTARIADRTAHHKTVFDELIAEERAKQEAIQ